MPCCIACALFAASTCIASESAERLAIVENVLHSSKLRWLLDQLERIKSKQGKTVVFTEHRDIQRLLPKAEEERFGLEVSIVVGSTTVDLLNDAPGAPVSRLEAPPGPRLPAIPTW